MQRKLFPTRLMLTFFVVILFVVAGCNTAPSPPEQQNTPVAPAPSDETENSSNAGYPDNQVAGGSGYESEPAPNPDILSEPPSADITAPEPVTGGAVYGILVQEVSDEGFLPLLPRGFHLAEVIMNSNGEPALIRRSVDSPKAELFQTGVFVFNNVPPGDYGLLVDVGFNELTINDDSGNPMIITVEEATTQNLQQVFVELP